MLLMVADMLFPSRRTSHLLRVHLHAVMEVLVLLLAALLLPPAGGAPPTADGCYLASSEINLLREEGEPIILSFPFFEGELERLHVAPPAARCLITRGNGTEGGTYQGEGRVQQRHNQLWFLPAQAEDSGEYLCTYRNARCCVRASIRLQVYRSGSAARQSFSFPVGALVGEHLRLPCPSVKDFPGTRGPVEWRKDSDPPRTGRAGSFLQDGDLLLIPAVRRAHEGAYTCRLDAIIDQQHFKVSRTVVLSVEGVDPVTTGSSSTSTSPSSSSSSSHKLRPLVILSPQNGSVFGSVHGSAMALSCTVLTDCRVAEETAVTWLVNERSVESSYLEGRALQVGRRVTVAPDGCRIELRLVVLAMTEDDVQTALRCVAENRRGRQEVVSRLQLEDSTFTWLMVSAVGVSCFLTVVSVFLFVLFRPSGKRNTSYFLARQSSF
ncbi:interleukin-1 receptor type 2-like isoform 2-T2 [Spinachia spinachia]